LVKALRSSAEGEHADSDEACYCSYHKCKNGERTRESLGVDEHRSGGPAGQGVAVGGGARPNSATEVIPFEIAC
jgi:hypothetical protein